MNKMYEYAKSLSLDDLGVEGYLGKLGWKKCSFDNQCDYCKKPEGGTFAHGFNYPMSDDGMWICASCAKREVKAGNILLDEYKMQVEPHGDIL